MEIINKVGLEAEFFLYNKKGDLDFPGDFGFATDNFPLLGELRAIPGKSREETVGFFFQALANCKMIAKNRGVTLHWASFMEITPEQKSVALKRMGRKEISKCKNLYKTDILGLSDDVVENGKLIHTKISGGLHIHFSKEINHTHLTDKGVSVTEKKYILRESEKRRIIKAMDTKILPKYNPPVSLKYRNPGFYEDKPWGFEYRSLPMIPFFTQLDELVDLVDFCFGLLEKLEN
jgi:hypothetical protein